MGEYKSRRTGDRWVRGHAGIGQPGLVAVVGGTAGAEPGHANDTRTHREFGPLLRHHRRRAGLTQRHMADLATVSVRAIRNLEQGKVRCPRPETVRLLAEGLGLGTADAEALLEAARHPWPVEPDGTSNESFSAQPWSVLGPLIGRESEVAALTELLNQPGRRLVNVVGIGGVGKSHLAAEAARLAVGHGATVLWLARGEAVTAEELARQSRVGPVSVVLDDADVSPAGIRRMVSLMRGHVGLRLLLTASRPSGLPGEHVLPLPPLPVPGPGAEADIAQLAQVASVQLLCAQIRRSQPAFRLNSSNAPDIAELCRRLDGIPRALEFAGNWSLVRSSAQLLADITRSPFNLTAPPMMRDPSPDPAVQLRRTLGRLTPLAASVLAALAHHPRSWSITDAAHAGSTSESAAAAIVFTLLTYGLVRTEAPHGQERRFSVLHHVRHLYADAASPVDEIPDEPSLWSRATAVGHRGDADGVNSPVAIGDA